MNTLNEYKGNFGTLQQAYTTYQNGGQSGWFIIAGGLFYYWDIDHFEIMLFESFQPQSWLGQFSIGNYTFIDTPTTEDRPIGLPTPSVNTEYKIVVFETVSGHKSSLIYSTVLYVLDESTNSVQIVTNINQIYAVSSLLQAEEVNVSDIPVLKYLKDPVDTINDLYIKYPLGGSEGWYAFVNDIKNFCYWDVGLQQWEKMPTLDAETAEIADILNNFQTSTPTDNSFIIGDNGQKFTLPSISEYIGSKIIFKDEVVFTDKETITITHPEGIPVIKVFLNSDLTQEIDCNITYINNTSFKLEFPTLLSATIKYQIV